MTPQIQSHIGPSIKMRLHINTAADSLTRPNRPILLKGLDPIDGSLVVTGRLVNIVCTAVGIDGSLVYSAVAGVIGTVGFYDVVFHERVAGPAVDGEVAVAGGGEVAAVVDGSGD